MIFDPVLWPHGHIHDVYKIFGQATIVISSRQITERSLYKHIYSNEWFLSLIERIYSKINIISI